MAIKLKDTCLCAIVRDEKINPAGGILDYIKSVVPHVDAAVIIDTGSTDGTREILEECAGRYKNLQIHDRGFRGFADARNYSLNKGKKTGADYCFVLDADERLTKEDFKCVNSIVEENVVNFYDVYRFKFRHILIGGQLTDVPDWGRRLFAFKLGPYFENDLWESLYFENGDYSTYNMSIAIKHFLPPQEGRVAKRDWYEQIETSPYSNKIKKGHMPPSAHEFFHLWKTPNPHRYKFR